MPFISIYHWTIVFERKNSPCLTWTSEACLQSWTLWLACYLGTFRIDFGCGWRIWVGKLTRLEDLNSLHMSCRSKSRKIAMYLHYLCWTFLAILRLWECIKMQPWGFASLPLKVQNGIKRCTSKLWWITNNSRPALTSHRTVMFFWKWNWWRKIQDNFFPGEIPGMVGQVEMFMSIFNMLQQDRGRRATGNITFTEFEQLFDRREIRAFFEVGFSVSTKCLLWL